MQLSMQVVWTEMFKSKKTGKTYTKLFVPVDHDVVSVLAEGDLAELAGVEEVPFILSVRDGHLTLRYNGEEVI